MTELVVRLAALAVVLATALPLARGAARRAEGAARPEPAAVGVTLPLGAYARHAVGAAAAGMVTVLAIWTMAATGEALALLGDSAPLRRLSQGFVTSGLVTLLLSVWLAGAVGAPVAVAAARIGLAAGPAADMALRALLTLPVSVGVFMVGAEVGGALGGDWRNAVAAAPQSFLYGLTGQGVWGAFVWAAALSGLPMTVAAAWLRAGASATRAAAGAAATLALAAAPAALLLALAR